jgi:hypothetical protein
MDDVDAADATGGSAFTAAALGRWRVPPAIKLPIWRQVLEMAKSTKGKLSARPGSVLTASVPHALFQEYDAFRVITRDPITRAEVNPSKNPCGDSRDDFLEAWTQHPCVVWAPHIQMNRVLNRMPCPVGGFNCVTGPVGMNHWGPRFVHGKPSYYMWAARYECKNPACDINTFLGYDHRVLRFLPPSVISLFPALVTKRCALDLHLLDEMRRTSVAGLKFAEHARSVNEYNRLHHLRRETVYYDYVADRRRPTPGALPAPAFAMQWPVYPYPKYDSDEWGGRDVSANYLANCYVADFDRREQWQDTRQATITGRFARTDHTFAVAKNIRVDNKPPFEASFSIMNESQQIMMSGFVEDTGFPEMSPAIGGLARRCVTRYLFVCVCAG